MLFVGIDVGKNNHVASMMDENGKVVFKAFSFSNTTDGGNALFSKLSAYSSDPSGFEIGMEATGHYWLSVYSFLFEKGFLLHVINPIQTDGWRRGTEIRKRKNDAIDSVLIADLIRYGQFIETRPADENLFSLRTLTRFRTYLVESISDLKRKVVCVLDQVFPEYQSIFSNIFGKTSKEILLQFSSPIDFENVSSETLAELLAQLSRQKIGSQKAEQLKAAASSSFGITFAKNSFTFQLKTLVEQISFIENQVKETEAEISGIMGKLESPITTITGIGNVTGAAIISEIGDISKFDNPRKLVAFAGIDASVTQSGEFEATHNVMSKRGSPYLRKAIFQAALIASFKDPVLSGYYQKKRSEGKHHLTCVGAVARKMCNIIYAVLKNNEPYIPKA
ncbi:IS110 family RNA-guided transposase [Luxibacter massiliensis]|uniref:IS110 family transposase n=1 Tax=Luxibacter massiliensis TaxID=2219695 RepID=UPI000F04D20C|nr:IS110 family transposase [Luxibacter massiliensis]